MALSPPPRRKSTRSTTSVRSFVWSLLECNVLPWASLGLAPTQEYMAQATPPGKNHGKNKGRAKHHHLSVRYNSCTLRPQTGRFDQTGRVLSSATVRSSIIYAIPTAIGLAGRAFCFECTTVRWTRANFQFLAGLSPQKTRKLTASLAFMAIWKRTSRFSCAGQAAMASMKVSAACAVDDRRAS